MSQNDNSLKEEETESEISELEQLIQNVALKAIRHVSSGISLADQSGKIIYTNESYAKILRCETKNLIGQNCPIINQALNQKTRNAKPLVKALFDKKEYRERIQITDCTGAIRWVEYQLLPVKDNNKHYSVTLIFDVTNIVHMQYLVMNARDEERQRIAQDLHDKTIQYLAIAGAVSEGAAYNLHYALEDKKHPVDEEPLQDRDITFLKNQQELFNDIVNNLSKANKAIRQNIFNVIHQDLVKHGLVYVLVDLQQEFNNDHNLNIKLQCNYQDANVFEALPLKYDTAKNLYYMIREAACNSLRHANCNEIIINVNIDYDKDQLKIVIQDDGVGYNTLTTEPGVGTATREARALEIGATLSVTSTPKFGTAVAIFLPHLSDHFSQEATVPTTA